jgi:hypothetical protein
METRRLFRALNVVILVAALLLLIDRAPVWVMYGIAGWQLGDWVTPLRRRMNDLTDRFDATKSDEVL